MRVINVETYGDCADTIVRDKMTGERIDQVTKLEVVFEAGGGVPTGRMHVRNPDYPEEMIEEDVNVLFFGGPLEWL